MASRDPRIVVDLYSDTTSHPTAEMRRAMAKAEVGDEQLREDPTVNALCERAADLLGHEAALFLPSGTMCNLIAIAVHCRAGDEIIAAEASHIITWEGAGAAAIAGSFVRGIATTRGQFSAEHVSAAFRGDDPKTPRSRLLSLEQTHNSGGGSIWPLAALIEVTERARQLGLATHLDGARLFNATVAAGVAADQMGRLFDSVWFDLSKGLGCPVGAVMAGSAPFIAEAHRWKHRLGGAMRQAGVLAAAGLYALDHHVERLAVDHQNAQHLAARIAPLPGLRLCQEPVETNMVYFDIAESGWTTKELSRHLAERGVRISYDSGTLMRAVTHLDVDRAGIDRAADALEELMGNT